MRCSKIPFSRVRFHGIYWYKLPRGEAGSSNFQVPIIKLNRELTEKESPIRYYSFCITKSILYQNKGTKSIIILVLPVLSHLTCWYYPHSDTGQGSLSGHSQDHLSPGSGHVLATSNNLLFFSSGTIPKERETE